MSGGITKMGSRLVRWAALEAIARYHGGSWLQRDFIRIAEHRGLNPNEQTLPRRSPDIVTRLTLIYED